MFEALVPLLNYDSKARGNASPYAGLIFSPAEVRSAKYQRDYDELAKHLRGLEPHFDLEDW